MTTSDSLCKRLDATGVPLLTARLVVGVYFVYSGLVKIFEPIEFLKQIRLYHMLPEEPAYLLNSVAIVLPWCELFCGVALILGVLLRGAAAILIMMLCVFTAAVFLRALTVMRESGTAFLQLVFDCGCGAGPVVIWRKLVWNLVLLCGASFVLLSRTRKFCATLVFQRREPDPAYCHLCGYAATGTRRGVCETCQQAPTLSA